MKVRITGVKASSVMVPVDIEVDLETEFLELSVWNHFDCTYRKVQVDLKRAINEQGKPSLRKRLAGKG